MKKLLFLAAILLFGLTSCEQSETNQGVVINGVKWATHNVGESGRFVRHITMSGRYFSWEEAQSACPQGWRLPTQQELQSFVTARSAWTSRSRNESDGDGGSNTITVQGGLFGSGDNSVFLPAAGWRGGNTGSVVNYNRSGRYWSSTSSAPPNAVFLQFDSDNISVGNNAHRSAGFSVRCVKITHYPLPF